MTLAIVCAGLLVLALVAYATTGGADFGGGVWDLFAAGPRRDEQRALIERAIAPVWEANHVWLIFAAVVLFTAFPPAYAAASVLLHVPLVLLLLGIVLRGSAFVFRQYGGEPARGWGRVFAVTSLITPLLLGVLAGALTSGRLPTDALGPLAANATFASVYIWPWLQPFPLAVGLFALVLFAFLAAVYLAWEAADAELANDFRRRALGAALGLAPLALGTALLARTGAPAFAERFTHSPWAWPLHLATGLAAIIAIGALVRRRYGLARVAAFMQVSLILGGWAAAHYPYLIAPGITIESARAPTATLALVVPVITGGMLLLGPSLYWLFAVFKQGRSRPLVSTDHQ